MMSNQKLFYLRTPNANTVRSNGKDRGDPIACIASQFVNDKLYYAISILNPKDRFDRTLAREIAIGRLTVSHNDHFNRFFVYLYGTVNKHVEITFEILKHVAMNNKLPNRIRVSAQSWCEEYNKRRTLTNT